MVVLTVAVIVLIVVVVVCVLCNMCSSTSGSVGPSALSRVSKAFKKKARVQKPSQAARYQANQAALQRSRPRRYQTGHHAAPHAQSAPLPAAQLMAQPHLPQMDSAMSYAVSTSNSIGDSEMDRATTEAGGNSSNTFVDTSYAMDPGMMTPGSTTDIQGLETFMPMMNDGVGKANGPVDPSTGLPLFTTGKLVRSQMLGGHGPGSFLRQQQDPLSGYKRLGKNICGAQNARRDLSVRRAQFNEARLADPNGDPVLFNTSEFAYS